MKGCDEVSNVRRQYLVLEEENSEALFMQHLNGVEEMGSVPAWGVDEDWSHVSHPLGHCKARDRRTAGG